MSGRRPWGVKGAANETRRSRRERVGVGKGRIEGYDTWYDWALVWRYWHRDAEGLRAPYALEQLALLRLGDAAGMSVPELGAHLGFSERTIARWRTRSLTRAG